MFCGSSVSILPIQVPTKLFLCSPRVPAGEKCQGIHSPRLQIHFSASGDFSSQPWGIPKKPSRKCSLLGPQLCLTLSDPVDSTRFLCPRDSPGKNTEVGCHFLLQGTFPTPGSNPGALHYRQSIHCLKARKVQSYRIPL